MTRALQADGTDVTTLAAFGGGGGSSAAPNVTTAQAPRGDAQVSIAGAQAAGDARVVAGLRARYRACFNSVLTKNPNHAGGDVTIAVDIAANGDVVNATVTAPRMPAELVSCLAHGTKLASFDASPVHSLTLMLVLRNQP